MHAEGCRGGAHRLRIEHALEVIEPEPAVAQARQRRPRQGAKGLAAGATAVALQASVASMLVMPLARTAGAGAPGRCCRLDRGAQPVEAEHRTQALQQLPPLSLVQQV
jgi:hypothetical protein